MEKIREIKTSREFSGTERIKLDDGTPLKKAHTHVVTYLLFAMITLPLQAQVAHRSAVYGDRAEVGETVHRNHVIVKFEPQLARALVRDLQFVSETQKRKLTLKSIKDEDRMQYWRDRASLAKTFASQDLKKSLFSPSLKKVFSFLGVYYLERASQSKRLENLFYVYYDQTLFSPLDVAGLLETQKEVVYAQPDGLATFAYQPSDSFYDTDQAFYMEPLKMPLAWDIATGQGVIIAIVDQAVDVDHPDLAPNIWVNVNETLDGVDNDGNGYVDDINGIVDGAANHGTSVAGVAAAHSAPGSNEGVTGMAFNATIMPVATSLGGSTIVSFAEAIDYAVAHGAQVINNSWHIDPLIGGPSIREAFENAYQASVITMNAGGNGVGAGSPNGSSCEIVPAGFATGLTVAGVEGGDLNMPVEAFSDGYNLDVAAVGTLLYTTNDGGGYGSFGGTSGATPMASGLVALLLEVNPGLSVEAIKTIMRTTAADTGDPGFDIQSGHGLISPLDALVMAQSGSAIPELNLMRPDCENIVGLTDVFVRVQATGAATLSLFLADSDDHSDFHPVYSETINGNINLSSLNAWTTFNASTFNLGPAVLKLVLLMQDGTEVVDYNETRISSYQIGDRVFEDINMSGVYTQGLDTPLEGILVELWDADEYPTGQPLATATTDAEGLYLFDNLSPDETYVVYLPENQPGLEGFHSFPADPIGWNFLGNDVSNGNPFTVVMDESIVEALYADFGFVFTDGNDLGITIHAFYIDDDGDLSTQNRVFPPEGAPVYKNGNIAYHINVVNFRTTPVDIKISNFMDPINLVNLNLAPPETPTSYGFDHIKDSLEPYTDSYEPYLRTFTADVLGGLPPQLLCDTVQLLERNASNPSQYDPVMEDKTCLSYELPLAVTKELQAVYVGGNPFNEVSNPPADYDYQLGDWIQYRVTVQNLMPSGNTLDDVRVMDDLHANLAVVVGETSPGYDPTAAQQGLLVWDDQTITGGDEISFLIIVQVINDDDSPICNVAEAECGGVTAASGETDACIGTGPLVRITEVFPQQGPWLQEPYGIHPWIEITSISDAEVSLDGIVLQSQSNSVTLSGTLTPGNRQYVVCQLKSAFDAEYSGQGGTGFDRNCDQQFSGAILADQTYELLYNGIVFDSVTLSSGDLAGGYPSSLIIQSDQSINPSAIAYGTPGYILEIGDTNESDADPYTIPPHGISTFDLLLAQQHILGVNTIDTIRGWQNMASASELCNPDGFGLNQLTTFDQIVVRRIILGTSEICLYEEDYGDVVIGTNLGGKGGKGEGTAGGREKLNTIP